MICQIIKRFACSRWMQCEARSQVNQGESEGVDLRPRLKMSPLICQEIAHNAPPQVVFFTKNKTTPFHNASCVFTPFFSS